MVKDKISKIQAYLAKKGLDGALFANVGHQISDDVIYYLFLQKLEYAYLYIPKSGDAVLFAIPFEVDQLAAGFPDITVLPISGSLDTMLKDHITTDAKYGARFDVLPHSLGAKLSKGSWIDMSNLSHVMGVKNEEEIAHMKKAVAITDDIFAELTDNFSHFKREKDVSNFIHQKAVGAGCDVAFPSIVASGPNAALPHHRSADVNLHAGFCVIDFGVRYNGYCSDMTRTIFIGSPSTEEQEIYDTLLRVQRDAIQMVRSDVKASDIADKVRLSLGPELEPLFIHSLGHGLGTQVHEWPRVSTKSDVILKESMVITIEPGVYKKDAYGIRIEDDVLVTQDSAEVLTTSTKDLICV